MTIYLSSETTDAYLRLLGGLGTRIPITEGDAVFYTHDNKPVWVERKKIKQLAMCAMQVGNLNSQIRRAKDAAEAGVEYAALYLVIEGLWRPGDDGLVELPDGRGGWQKLMVFGPTSFIEYSRVDGYLNTLETVEEVRVKRVGTERESPTVLIDLYHWWQKPIESHTSTKRWSTGGSGEKKQLGLGDAGKPSLVRRWAAELPGVGWEIAKKTEEHFGCVHNMILASEQDWQTIEGIGKITAKRIIEEIHGTSHNSPIRKIMESSS